MPSFTFDAIGIIHSCYKEKFGIPRQPGLVPAAEATLELLPPYDRMEALEGITAYSHLWLSFVFHGISREQWKPTVRPPRLGGNRRVGVFASRSTHRPNPIGLSVVELLGVEQDAAGHPLLRLRGADLLDQTPVLDIKPYIPYVDALPNARAELAPDRPATCQVEFDGRVLPLFEAGGALEPYRDLVIQVLENDPRPAYHRMNPEPRIYGVRLLDFDIQWEARGDTMRVIDVRFEPQKNST
jgi:tRNA-Thr(GGU) m(6)t(6)A37 methyltransferase TsaA